MQHQPSYYFHHTNNANGSINPNNSNINNNHSNNNISNTNVIIGRQIQQAHCQPVNSDNYDNSITAPVSLVNNRINALNGTLSSSVRRTSPSINSSNTCYLCNRLLTTHQSLLINEHHYHRDCFKCSKCDKYLADNEAYTLVDHKFFHCGTCFIKRKPLQSMIASIKSNANASTNTNTAVNSNPSQSVSSMPTSTNSTLNDLKLRFEPSSSKLHSSIKPGHIPNNLLSNPGVNTDHMIGSNVANTQNQNQPIQSFSTSSSSSNFSLSPSSSSSLSSTNSSANMAISTSLINLNLNQFNQTSQINQRISMLNNFSVRHNSSGFSSNTTPSLESNQSHQPLNPPIALKPTLAPTSAVNETESSNHKILARINELNRNEVTHTSNILSTQFLASDLKQQAPSLTNILANLNKNNETKATLVSSTHLLSSSNCSLTKLTQPTNYNYNTPINSNSNQKFGNWDNLKSHSNQCNIIIRKSRRKRSKSLPSKFNVDSLLDYLNCSMIQNKHELKKLHHQRHQVMNSSTASSSASSYSLKNRHRQMLTSNYYQHSSGYNSENLSNSSNSTSANYQSNSNNNLNYLNLNQLNFYRLSLSHLPIHLVHFQCTCGASDVNNSMISSIGSSDLSLLATRSNRRLSSKVLSSSPNLKNDIEYEDDDEEDDEEDDDLEDDLDDEDIDEDSDLENENNILLNQSLDLSNKTATIFNEALNIHQNLSLNVSQNMANFESDKSILTIADDRFNFLVSTTKQCAPGTSTCLHTARIDLRRVRSCRDLTQRQLIYSPSDFVFKEKLGEGFFANVKKIISKESNKEMVLKELKLSCIESQASSAPSNELSSCTDLTENLNQNVDFLVNYAELNAAHRSFLKEAQVLRNLSHPNVIKFMGIMFTKEKHLNLILEYISGGTLKDIIHNISNALPWKLRVGYAKDIAAAMQYLHSLNIIHRDLKSDNCLVKDNGRTVVVADFGLSRIINTFTNSGTSSFNKSRVKVFKTNRHNLLDQNDSLTSASSLLRTQNSHALTGAHSPQSSATNSFIVAAKRKLKRNPPQQRKQRYAVVGNSFSMAPEMLKHQIYDERVDIFSFGIICCEIIGRVQADPDYLPRTSDFGLNVELFRKKYCEADCPKQFIKIAIACCELEPEKRPPFSKTHLWLETILTHLEANNPIPKNLLKNILDQNNKRPLSSMFQGGSDTTSSKETKN